MLSGWHDFFVVLGAAAGTLIGAMFVVVSIGGGLVKGSALPSRIFVTPIIMHLAVVLLFCAVVLVPSMMRLRLGAMAGAVGIVFLAYAVRNAFHIRRRDRVEWSDHLWYALCPVIAYLLMIAGAAMVLKSYPGAVDTIAFALALLVVGGIRNAWDLILFFLERQNTDRAAPPP
ncbi:MAG TPA: hypothetical protein VKV32_07895 [Stellaceae bacterium]|nr:hypothetical protein [Stellaceae bacterium]